MTLRFCVYRYSANQSSATLVEMDFHAVSEKEHIEHFAAVLLKRNHLVQKHQGYVAVSDEGGKVCIFNSGEARCISLKASFNESAMVSVAG